MTSPPRVLVTGSRNWTDPDPIYRALEAAWTRHGRNPETVLIHGACHLGGADIIARDIWNRWGLPDEPHPAEIVNGRVLGPKRNQAMVDLGASLCLAFPLIGSCGTIKSRGTLDCIRRANAAGIETWIFSGGGER